VVAGHSRAAPRPELDAPVVGHHDLDLPDRHGLIDLHVERRFDILVFVLALVVHHHDEAMTTRPDDRDEMITARP
jgi:hypothetical protein